MADSQEQTRSIARTPKNQWGYSVSQVDEFLNSVRQQYEASEPTLTQQEIQNVSFDLEKNGYDTKAVDDVLRRLENAVVDKLARWTILNEGTQAWIAQTEQLALTLIPRMKRENGHIFERSRRFTPSYDVHQVDSFVRAVVQFIDKQLALGALDDNAQAASAKRSHRAQDAQPSHFTSQDAELKTFIQRSGHGGYDEAQVDAFINRIREVLTRMESTRRVQDIDHLYTTADDANSAASDSSIFAATAYPYYTDDTDNSDDEDSFEELEELADGVDNDSADNDSADESNVEVSAESVDIQPIVLSDTENSQNSVQAVEEKEETVSASSETPADSDSSDSSSESEFDEITRTEEKMFTVPSIDLPQSFVPEHKPERGSTRTDSNVDYSGLMDTGSIQSVPFHLPKLDNDTAE